MPQSKTRKAADQKRKVAQARKIAERQDANEAERLATEPERRAAERRAERAAARAEREEASVASQKKSSSSSKDGKSSTSGSKASGKKDDDDTKKTERRTTAERRGLSRKDSGTTAVRKGPVSRRWVAPLFVTLFLLGVAWLIVYYVAGGQIPYMSDWGYWNIAIGMGLMAGSFIVATQWK